MFITTPGFESKPKTIYWSKTFYLTKKHHTQIYLTLTKLFWQFWRTAVIMAINYCLWFRGGKDCDPRDLLWEPRGATVRGDWRGHDERGSTILYRVEQETGGTKEEKRPDEPQLKRRAGYGHGGQHAQPVGTSFESLASSSRQLFFISLL